MADDRFTLVWAEGLCRHGCGEPLASPRNRFINGHDGKLMDLLVDAESAGVQLELLGPGGVPGFGVRVAPRFWAARAFSPAGLAHYEWLVAHPGSKRRDHVGEPPAEMVGEVLAAWSADGRSPEELDRLNREAWVGSELAEDLETIREVTAKAKVADEDVRDRMEMLERENQRVVQLLISERAERQAELDLLESEAARQIGALQEQLSVATAPVTVTVEGLAQLSSRQVLSVAATRARAAAKVFRDARYEGDEGELWDLAGLFSGQFVDPVRVRAARAFLGEEIKGL